MNEWINKFSHQHNPSTLPRNRPSFHPFTDFTSDGRNYLYKQWSSGHPVAAWRALHTSGDVTARIAPWRPKAELALSQAVRILQSDWFHPPVIQRRTHQWVLFCVWGYIYSSTWKQSDESTPSRFTSSPPTRNPSRETLRNCDHVGQLVTFCVLLLLLLLRKHAGTNTNISWWYESTKTESMQDCLRLKRELARSWNNASTSVFTAKALK